MHQITGTGSLFFYHFIKISLKWSTKWSQNDFKNRAQQSDRRIVNPDNLPSMILLPKYQITEPKSCGLEDFPNHMLVKSKSRLKSACYWLCITGTRLTCPNNFEGILLQQTHIWGEAATKNPCVGVKQEPYGMVTATLNVT